MSPQADGTVAAGTRVTVGMQILGADERAPGLPPDTAAEPYRAWIRGTLEHDAALGEPARIRTQAGRTVEGILSEVEPADTHTFGRPTHAWVEMVARIGRLKEELK